MIVGSADIAFTNNGKKSIEAGEAANGALEAASKAVKAANGKSTNYYGSALPTGEQLNENDTWFSQDSSGVCNGIYQYKNGVWVQAELDHEALKIRQLSAITADIGNITAGNISGINLNLGIRNPISGHYPFEADSRGKVYMSDLTINNESSSPIYGFLPYITIADGKWQGFSRIKRIFDNMGTEQPAYYDVITTIEGGQFRARALNKKSTMGGTDSTFDKYGSRSLYMSERGLSTSDGIFKGTTNVGSSRYIDFWPGENGYNNDDSSQRGMEIFSGSGMRIAGGTTALGFDIESGGDLSLAAKGDIFVIGKGFYFNMKDLYVNGSGGGTLNSGISLTAGGLVTNSSALFLGVDSNVHITDKRGYNSGNGVSYMPLKASTLYANALDINTATHVYLRPTAGGVVRVTATGTTDTYRPIQAKSFDVSSSYTYKQDIKEMTRSALDILDALKIYEYRMKSDVEAGILDDWQIGLIAEYSPQVSIDDGMKINMYKLESLHFKATQEIYTLVKGLIVSQEIQENRLNEMEKTIQQQNELIRNMNERIEALEKK